MEHRPSLGMGRRGAMASSHEPTRSKDSTVFYNAYGTLGVLVSAFHRMNSQNGEAESIIPNQGSFRTKILSPFWRGCGATIF